MKNKEEIEIAEHYYERSMLVLTVSVATTVLLVGTCMYILMYKEFESHGVALVLVPPALFALFQTLIFILTPYAFIFKDKMEVKKHMFFDKFWYFNDIKKVSEVSKHSFVITYNDGDEETVNLKGIKPAHLKDLRDELHKQVSLTLEKREKGN